MQNQHKQTALHLAASNANGFGAENVTEAEQAQYNSFVENGFFLLYQSADTILDQLRKGKQAGQIIEAAASIAATIAGKLIASAREEGVDVSAIAYQGSIELLEEIDMLSTEAGIYDFSEAELERVLFRALDIFMKSDNSNPEDYEEDAAMLIETDKAGQMAGFFGSGS